MRIAPEGVAALMQDVGMTPEEAARLTEKLVIKHGHEVPLVSVFLTAFIVIGEKHKELESEVRSLKKRLGTV